MVEDVLDGDRESYRVLVRRYQDALYRHAVRMVGHAEADDVVQRALVRGYRRLDSCREPEKVGGWLFRITSNLCKDHLRGPGRDGVALEDAGPLESSTADPETELERSELAREIDRALERLTPDQREAFLLKHVEGLSYPEMADRLSASVSALKMRVHRARESLQELLEGYGSVDTSEHDG